MQGRGRIKRKCCTPNRKFVIKADLKDDLGLKNLKIIIPEFYLDNLRRRI